MPGEITLTVDGVPVTAKPGETVIQAAMNSGLYVPYLCYWPGMKPYGACRMCVVEVEGQRGTPASCTLPATDGMIVHTKTPVVEDLRKGILEMLLSEHPHGCLTCHRIELCGPQDICLRHVRVTDRCVVCPKNERCELKDTVRFSGVNMETPLTYNYRNLPIETKDPFYDRDYNLCIVCARCVRVCEEIRGDDAICMVDRSGTVLVGTSIGTSLLESGCEFCGACVDVCPVGALVERDHKWAKADHKVATTCPHCPVGCQVNLEIDRRGQLIRSVGDWQSDVNVGQLCFKGKFGMTFVNSDERLRKPLVRREGQLVEVGWEEALTEVAWNLSLHRGDRYGLLVSPQATNEEAYLGQKFARAVMRTNNVDVSSDTNPDLVTALGESVGEMAATGSLKDLENASCVLVVNSNITEDHNVAAVPIKRAQRAGTLKLVVIDAREVELTRYANIWLRPRPGTEVALLGGLIRVILDEGLEDSEFVSSQTDGYEALVAGMAQYKLDWVEKTTGVSVDLIKEAARLFASQHPGAILYALDDLPAHSGVSAVRALANLVLLTGNLGRPSTGLFPLRSGTNEQGAWDVGCVPNLLPGYVPVNDTDARVRIEKSWSTQLPTGPGKGFDALLESARHGDITAMQVVGDSRALGEMALKALSNLQFLVVQESFLSPLARLATVVLPTAVFSEKEGSFTNLERRVQLLRKGMEPKGEAMPDWWVFVDLARRMGGQGFHYGHPSEILDELAGLVPAYGGISYSRLEDSGIQWPCTDRADHGTRDLYSEGFKEGLAHFLPLEEPPAPKLTTRGFPLMFTPGRVLVQSDRPMEVISGNGLNRIEREEFVDMHPRDAAGLGVSDGDSVELVTPVLRIQGTIRLNGLLEGVVSSTGLFGQLALDLDASPAPDKMLRVPRLSVTPARIEKVTG